MSKNRVIYQNWIVDLGGEPNSKAPNSFLPFMDELESSDACKQKQEELEQAVKDALSKLSETEREFVIRYYYMGESFTKISEQSNRAVYKLAAMHTRVLKKLRASLSVFVEANFDVEEVETTKCKICSSDHLEQINQIIQKRDRRKTWSPVIKLLKKDYGLIIKTPQILIGHEKYHIKN